MHLCMEYFMYSCMLSCCIYECMCVLYVACLSSVSLHVFHAFITVHFVCNRSRLFLLLKVEKMLHTRCSKFLQQIQEPFLLHTTCYSSRAIFCYTLHSCGECGNCVVWKWGNKKSSFFGKMKFCNGHVW
ncbi:hypothetical protein AMTRI_Chr10g227640 [Amborella trichopoda]